MRILLLTPQTFHQSWPIQNDFVKNICKIPPLSQAILSASIKGKHDVTFCDAANQPLSRQKYLYLIESHDLIAISAYTPFSAINNEITLKIVKERWPDKPVVMGGHHATYYDRRWLLLGLDAVVRGEGERTFPELVDAMDRGTNPSEVSGISFLEKGAVFRTEDRSFIQNLDDSPMPDFELLKGQKFDFLAGSTAFVGPVETSRGCPYRCSFCWVSGFWGARQRFKSVSRVIEEMQCLDNIGASQFAFVDDNFAAKPKFYGNLFDKICSRELEKPSFAFLRVDTITCHPKLIKKAARAGLKIAYVGFESTDDTALDDFDKQQRGTGALEQSVYAHKILQEHGIFTVGLFVTGFPGHEQSDYETLRAAPKVCDMVAPVMYMPFVATSGYKKLLDSGAKIRDCFYHDRRLASFTKAGRTQENRIIWYYISMELSLKFIAKLISGSQVQRQYVKQQFKSAIKAIFMDFRPRHFAATLILGLPFFSIDKKLEFLKRIYLSDSFVKTLARKK